MGAPRSRTPNEPGARDIAGALYPDLDRVEWIPSDDADVFRLSFTSDREPRILKMATHGIRAVWREIGAFPAMRRLGIPEVLAFEHTSDDLPDLGIEFHITRELAHPPQASRALAELWSSDRARALDVAHWLGDCTGRIEALDRRRVPRANSPERSAEIGVDWCRPQYAQLLARPDCPAWARTFIDHVSGSLTALALEILLRFGAADPAPLVERFLAGWVPAGLDQSRLEELRLWWAHGILWWAGLDLSMGAGPDVNLTGVYAAARHCLQNDDPVSWLSHDTAAAAH